HPQPHPAAAGLAARALADKFDARRLQRLHHLHQRVDGTPHIGIALFHALDRGQRHPRQLRQAALVEPQQGARSPHLRSGDHGVLRSARNGRLRMYDDVSYMHVERKCSGVRHPIALPFTPGRIETGAPKDPCSIIVVTMGSADQAALRLALLSATLVSFWSVAISSLSVWSSSLAASAMPSCWAQVFSVP